MNQTGLPPAVIGAFFRHLVTSKAESGAKTPGWLCNRWVAAYHRDKQMIDTGLRDRVAIVTGANNPHGIGAGIAKALGCVIGSPKSLRRSPKVT